MSFAVNCGQWLLALSLSLNSLGTPLARSAPPTSQAEEAALRQLAETFFANWAAKDLKGFLALWSAQAPELAAREKATRELFANSTKLEVNQLLVRKVQAEGAKAQVQVALNAVVTEAKTGQPRAGYGKLLRTLHCVKEAAGWKVWRELATVDDFAATLAAAQTAQERAALLAQEPELQSLDLQRALLRQGGRFTQQQKFDQARELFQLAQTLAEKLDNRAGIALALRNIGFTYGLQENYRQALNYFEKALPLLAALSRPAQAEFLRNLALPQRALGDYAAALDSSQRALAIFEELQDQDGIVGTLNNVAIIYRNLGEYDQALAAYQRGLGLLAAANNPARLAQTQLNISVVYSLRGDHLRALTHLQQALKLFQAIAENGPDVAETLHNIGTVYLAQGDPRQALEFYQRAQGLLEQAGRKESLAHTYSQTGQAHEELGDAARARGYYRKAQALYENLENKAGFAASLIAIGKLELESGSYAQALADFQTGLAIAESLNDSYSSAAALARLGAAYYVQGAYDQALAQLERATPLAEKTGSLQLLVELYEWVGKVQFARGQDAFARQAFEKAIAATETLRQQTAGGEQERQRLLENKLTPWHGLIRLLLKQQQYHEALVFAEQSKARVLLDVLQRGRQDIRKAMTPAEQAQERQLRAELTSLNAQDVRLKQANQPDPAALANLEARLNKARLAYEAFQTALYAAHPALRVQRGEAPALQVAELANWTYGAQSAVLEYVVTETATYLFALTPGANPARAALQVFTLPVKQAELSRQVESFRQQLARGDLGFRPAAARLYELLLRPAQAQLKGKTNLVIVPDGKLWELPFQALLTPAQRFLLEDTAIAYAPSLTVLREMTKQRQPQTAEAGTLLALGNPLLGQAAVERATLTLRGGKLSPLPEAEAEVKALGRLYGAARSKIYTGAEAREDRAKLEAANARVLHFATHGILNNAAPLYSHLVLTPQDAHEDGLLEAWELMQLELKADLAVLSACETARGRYGAGEGMIGLTWALFVAGVPTTVVSQWKVESAGTRDLMLSFHRTLNAPAKQQPPKAEALRQAALKLLKQPETSHPFYWAGFVLVGDGR